MITDIQNERSTKYVSAAFFDKDGVAAVPSTVAYRIDCATTGTAVLASTSVTPAASVEVEITPAQNAIIVAANARETKIVTFTATYTGGGEIRAEYKYLVRNLFGVT